MLMVEIEGRQSRVALAGRQIVSSKNAEKIQVQLYFFLAPPFFVNI